MFKGYKQCSKHLDKDHICSFRVSRKGLGRNRLFSKVVVSWSVAHGRTFAQYVRGLGSTPSTLVVGSSGDGGGRGLAGPRYWVKCFHNRLGL